MLPLDTQKKLRNFVKDVAPEIVKFLKCVSFIDPLLKTNLTSAYVYVLQKYMFMRVSTTLVCDLERFGVINEKMHRINTTKLFMYVNTGIPFSCLTY